MAERVAVQTGSDSGTLVEVKGKIAEGQHVVVRGAEHLEAGQKVRTDPGQLALVQEPGPASAGCVAAFFARRDHARAPMCRQPSRAVPGKSLRVR